LRRTLHVSETDRPIRAGSALALVGPWAAIGAPGWSSIAESGAVYVFDRARLAPVQKLLDPDATRGGDFGGALAAASSSELLVAAPLADTRTDDDGIVWGFGEGTPICGPCESHAPLLACVHEAGCRAEVWCLGDSITAIYASRLAELEPSWRVRNLGLALETSGAGFDRLRVILAQAENLPDVVVVLYGTNDIGMVGHFGGQPDAAAAVAAGGVAAIVTNLRERGVPSIVGLPIALPHGFRAARRDSSASALDHAFGALRARLRAMRPLVDFRLRRARWYADPLHPNAEGAHVLAQRARRAVRRLLARRASMAASRSTGSP